MACEDNQISTPPPIADPNDGVEAYAGSCVTYDKWFTEEAVPKMNAMYICINNWYLTILEKGREILTIRDETEEYMNQASVSASRSEGYAVLSENAWENIENFVIADGSALSEEQSLKIIDAQNWNILDNTFEILQVDRHLQKGKIT